MSIPETEPVHIKEPETTSTSGTEIAHAIEDKLVSLPKPVSMPIQGSEPISMLTPVKIEVAPAPVEAKDTYEEALMKFFLKEKIAGTSDFKEDGEPVYRLGDEYYTFRICLPDGNIFNGIGDRLKFASLHLPTREDEKMWINSHREIIIDMYNIDIIDYTGNQLWEKCIADKLCDSISYEDMTEMRKCLPKSNPFESVEDILDEFYSEQEENIDFYLRCGFVSQEIIDHFEKYYYE